MRWGWGVFFCEEPRRGRRAHHPGRGGGGGGGGLAVSNTLKTEHLPKRAGGEVAEPRRISQDRVGRDGEGDPTGGRSLKTDHPPGKENTRGREIFRLCHRQIKNHSIIRYSYGWRLHRHYYSVLIIIHLVLPVISITVHTEISAYAALFILYILCTLLLFALLVKHWLYFLVSILVLCTMTIKLNLL